MRPPAIPRCLGLYARSGPGTVCRTAPGFSAARRHGPFPCKVFVAIFVSTYQDRSIARVLLKGECVMTRFKPMVRLLLLLAVLLAAMVPQLWADLPPCDTYCNCTRTCFTLQCSVNGIPWRCGDWGICDLSCY